MPCELFSENKIGWKKYTRVQICLTFEVDQIKQGSHGLWKKVTTIRSPGANLHPVCIFAMPCELCFEKVNVSAKITPMVRARKPFAPSFKVEQIEIASRVYFASGCILCT